MERSLMEDTLTGFGIVENHEAPRFRPEFSLRLEGVLPQAAKQKRKFGKQLCERVQRGLLMNLTADECLEFCYAGCASSDLDWRITGGSCQSSGSKRNMKAMVEAALRGLQETYRFRDEPVTCDTDESAWSVVLHPMAKPLRAASRGALGYGTAQDVVASELLLPASNNLHHRVFESLADLVLSSPSPMALRVRFASFHLGDEQTARAASSLEAMRRAPHISATEAETDAEIALLESWLKERRGIKVSCTLRAQVPLPHSFIEMAGCEVFGCSVTVEAPTAIDGCDLSACKTISQSLPNLLPLAKTLADAGHRTVFNTRLPRLKADGPNLGVASSGGCQMDVRLPDEGRSRHSYIVGATGTGKSTLLGNLIRQDIAAGHGVALIDPHGDLFEYVLATLPARRAKDVVLIEPASNERVPGINFLDIPEGPLRRLQVNFVVTEFMGMFNQLYDMRHCGGPMFELYFRNAMFLLIESRCPGATILDLARVFTDKEFRKELCEHCKDKQAVSFWTQTAERTSGDASLANFTPYITSKLNQLTQSGPIRPIIGQAHTTIDFRKLMDNRGILLVNLSKGLLGELDTRLLGMVLIGQLFSAALGRATLPQNKRVPFHLYVDEFQNFVTDSIASLVAEARKFGLQLTLANQTLAQLAANPGQQNLLEAILGNVGNMIAFRLGVPDAERLAQFTEPDLPRQELQRLPNFHAFARLLTAEGPVDPFVFKSAPPAKASPHAKRVQAKIRENQTQWSKPLEEVEREIAQRLTSSRWADVQSHVNLFDLKVTELTDHINLVNSSHT